MDAIFFVFLIILVYFSLFMLLRSLTGWHFCVLCASVCTTWVSLLVLYWPKRFDALPLIAVLTGGTVVGIYYLVEQKTPDPLHVFRLPFFLTLLLLAYLILGIGEALTFSVLLLIALWLLFGGIYFYQHNTKIKGSATRLIECCKNW
jgi:hypothetical protein